MKIFNTVIIVLAIFLLSCKSEEKDVTTINAVKVILQKQVEENQKLTDYLFHREDSPIKPLNRVLLNRLNKFLINGLDISFTQTHSDTSEVKLSIKKLEKDYFSYIDSLKKSYNSRFSTEFEKILSEINFKLIYSSMNLSDLNYFFTIQNILSQHHQVLTALIHEFGPYEGFERIGDTGYNITINDDKITNKISFRYAFFNKHVILIPKEMVKLVNENGQIIKIIKTSISLNEIQLETMKLEKGNYTAEITYEIIRNFADSNETNLKFNFSIW